ncbi:MAG TPA: arylsulfatase, partial [Candidatus Hydrogenedentes bacterium]|nr:arylsulfatase [Candidatus Hydrogenedentota bacterium]
APILDGEKRAQTVPVFWEHNGNKAIRSGKWKLVAPARAEWELYDLEADRTELTNLADKEGRRADRMLADWTQWAGEVGAKV